MKNKILYLCLTICFVSNLYSLVPDISPDDEKLLYRMTTGPSTNIITMMHNSISYNVKIYSIDSIPYKGEVYLASNNIFPIKEVIYWDINCLYQNSLDFTATNLWSPLLGISIQDSIVRIKDNKQITLHIVDAFMGDTVFTNYFPSPSVATQNGNITNFDDLPLALQQSLAQSEIGTNIHGRVVITVPTEILSTNYSLPSGVYFAYFTNTNDGKLRWIEKIVK